MTSEAPREALNPHRAHMADPSMVRTLDAQARAIWPQESKLVERYALPADARILDAGCGTGEGSSRLARMFPQATVLAIDVLDHVLDLARSRYPDLAPRLTFEHRSIFELGLPDASFDLTVCRHVVHSIPQTEHVYAELKRVTKPGGWLHLIPEDYDMLHFQRATPDPREFWHEVPPAFAQQTGVNLFVGRDSVPILQSLGLTDIQLDYVIVDTLRVPRETFAEILVAWRDGYANASSEVSRFSAAEAHAMFDQMIANIRDPKGYAVWMVPVIGARVPAR